MTHPSTFISNSRYVCPGVCHDVFYEYDYDFKIAGGLHDNLLTCIVQAWDYSKPLFVALAMNTFMWNNPFTQQHSDSISELNISLIPPITKRLACGDYGNGAMAEPSLIFSTPLSLIKQGTTILLAIEGDGWFYLKELIRGIMDVEEN